MNLLVKDMIKYYNWTEKKGFDVLTYLLKRKNIREISFYDFDKMCSAKKDKRW